MARVIFSLTPVILQKLGRQNGRPTCPWESDGSNVQVRHRRLLNRMAAGTSIRVHLPGRRTDLLAYSACIRTRRCVRSGCGVIADGRSHRARCTGAKSQNSHQREECQFAFHVLSSFRSKLGGCNKSARTTSCYATHPVVRAIAPTAYAYVSVNPETSPPINGRFAERNASWTTTTVSTEELQSWNRYTNLRREAFLQPGWRNWQTQRTQNPPTFGSWGFDPPSRHQRRNGDILRRQFFFAVARSS